MLKIRTRLHRVPILLGHFLDTIRTYFVGTLCHVGFTAGSHTGTSVGRSKLCSHSGIDLVRLAAAKLVCRYQDLIGAAVVSLSPVMTVVDNTMNVLVDNNHPFVNY